MSAGTKTLQTPPPNIDATLPVLDVSTLPTLVSTSPTEAKAARRVARRISKRRFVRLEQHAAAVEHLDPLPGPGEIIHGFCNGTYSGWNLATAAIELLAEPIDELVAATLGFNRQNCDSLVALIDSGIVRSATVVVSDYFRSADREVFGRIRSQLEQRGQRIAVARSHAKLIMLRTEKRHIVIETSANLRSSQNHEQFAVSDHLELYAFHRSWLMDLIGGST